ncbi:MAG TPA: SDR family NAD(P)-dependent oxidoreductase, partial [Flavisolibacter sp.]|nr:SDR family NAD(P)-dependent oxidoreductase [Flavisolibacter sp.]
MEETKTALVTGGSGGIGSEICRHLAAAGYQVIVNFNANAGSANTVVESLVNNGHT